MSHSLRNQMLFLQNLNTLNMLVISSLEDAIRNEFVRWIDQSQKFNNLCLRLSSIWILLKRQEHIEKFGSIPISHFRKPK